MKTHPGEPEPLEPAHSDSPPPTMANNTTPGGEMMLMGTSTPTTSTPAPVVVVKSPLVPGHSAVTAEELLNIEPEFDQSLGKFPCLLNIVYVWILLLRATHIFIFMVRHRSNMSKHVIELKR